MTTVLVRLCPTRRKNWNTARSAAPVGPRLSNTSPVISTRSTRSRSIKPARRSSTVSSSSSRSIPFHWRPACQSLVCTISTRLVRYAREQVTRGGRHERLALPCRPSREREAQQDRGRDFRLRHDHRPRLQQRRAPPRDHRQETVLAALGFGGVESA